MKPLYTVSATVTGGRDGRAESVDPPLALSLSTPKSLGGTPVTIHLTVTDVDTKFQRAVDAGATVVGPLEDQFWGDRYGIVADPFGHHWSLGQPVRHSPFSSNSGCLWGNTGESGHCVSTPSASAFSHASLSAYMDS